ncbi:MAG TPA: MarR family transcriptional regulator [Candidatus Aenigmarchaeota archaeon]|nr:MarR family transcriptional regulator [Candidatus Aenigmarchaeota archaeon]
MRTVLIILILVLAANPIFGAFPSKYIDYNISIKLNENRVVTETIDIKFPHNSTQFNIYLIHQARNLEIYAGKNKINCDWRYERAGTLISCKNFNSSSIQIKFEYRGLVTQYEDYYVFSDRYIIVTPTENFNLRIYLPKGYILYETEEQIQLYYPTNGIQKTDGKIIYVEWNYNPKLGDVYDVSIFYEKALRSDQFAVIISTLFIILIMIFLFIYFRKQPKIVDLGLTEDEKKVLNVISHNKKVSQKKIVRETGLSKAQVSRIAKSLEARGLIERKRRGRSYEIITK